MPSTAGEFHVFLVTQMNRCQLIPYRADRNSLNDGIGVVPCCMWMFYAPLPFQQVRGLAGAPVIIHSVTCHGRAAPATVRVKV